MFDTSETIVAPATPAGVAGVAIVRLSGPAAGALVARFFRPSGKTRVLESHHLYHGHVVNQDGLFIDEVLAVIMRGPRSFTREDVAEIHCHGGPILVRQVVDLFVDGGARIARPGEFTLRAFLNGRLDLAQAEGLIDLIQSRSEAASQVALRQLGGALSRVVFGFRDQLGDVLALVEAGIDFPEDDLDHFPSAHCLEIIRAVDARIERLLREFDSGRVLREGMVVLILGRPNVGKSSLLNVLLGEARAIVTDIPGTTRDTLEENLVLGGIPLRVIDTAGVRETPDQIEREGIRRAREKIEGADLILLVVDGSLPWTADDHLALELCRERPTLLVINKADLPQVAPPPEVSNMEAVRISAHQGEGVERLKGAVVGLVGGTSDPSEQKESILLSDRRHRQALVRCRESLGRTDGALTSGMSPEIIAMELREALAALGEITGQTTPEMILEQIFSRFCIGK